MKTQQLKTVKIKSHSELIEFIETDTLEVEDLKTLLQEAYGIYITGQETKQEIIDGLERYFKDYTADKEMPLFLH